MEFVPYLDWVDVPDPANPPAGAKQIETSDLLRYERGLLQASQGLQENSKELSGRLSDSSLRAAFDRVFTPEAYGAKGDGSTNDAAAIQQAINAAVGANGRVKFSGKTYAVAAKLLLPATAPLRISVEPGGSILAVAAMSAVFEKPLGGSTGPIVLDELNIDANSLADAALDVLQSNRLIVHGGVYKNGKTCTVDIGRTGAQNYEMEWVGGKVIGRDNTFGKTKADRPAFAFRLGTGCTDNQVVDLKVKNALTCYQDKGQANTHINVHTYPYPVAGNPVGNGDDWAADTIGIHSIGSMGRFIGCYADTHAVGFKMDGYFNKLIHPNLLWAGGYSSPVAVVGVDITNASNDIIGGIFNGNSLPNVIGIRVGPNAFRVGIVENQFQGYFNPDGAQSPGNPIVYTTSEWGHRRGNEWDRGVLSESTQAVTRNVLNLDRGRSNEEIMKWGTGLDVAARLLAVGTGDTGYTRFDALAGGWQFATGDKLGFFGKPPVAQPAGTPAAATDLATTQALVNDIRAKLISLGLLA